MLWAPPHNDTAANTAQGTSWIFSGRNESLVHATTAVNMLRLLELQPWYVFCDLRWAWMLVPSSPSRWRTHADWAGDDSTYSRHEGIRVYSHITFCLQLPLQLVRLFFFVNDCLYLALFIDAAYAFAHCSTRSATGHVTNIGSLVAVDEKEVNLSFNGSLRSLQWSANDFVWLFSSTVVLGYIISIVCIGRYLLASS